ncbi:nucleotidyltransferase domain-containing protein, partial [Patescibacteria group bacterium]|nr:nucleotidyltransferase domain-containing protein [Patescibacteria group bacterium]
SQTRWPEVDELSRIIGWIGWVKGIGVTGSLAMKNIRPKSDIDFMIVTQPHRLWVTRLLVMLIIWIVGKRRTRHGAEDDSWCFNLWLDTASMDLPIYKQTIYSAYEVCQAKWVLDKDGTAQEFYQANQWVKVYLPNYYQECVVSGGEELIRTTKKHWSVFYWLWSWLWSSFFYLINLTAYAFQLVYMYPHLTREKVSLGFAYFHPRSTSNVVYQRWYNSLLVLWKN